MELVARFFNEESLNVVLNNDTDFNAIFEGCYPIVDIPVYEGETVVTPSDSKQVLNTENKLVENQIVIQPIPKNYGKIAYNGAHLIIT